MPIDDRQEAASQMEPMRISDDSRHRASLAELAFVLAQKAAGFHRSLPASLVPALADLVRSMNCYYSNLIEGHDTHPIDIERALKNDYSDDPRKRDLQREALAHIAVQKWIDGDGIQGSIASPENLRDLHRRFCERVPDDLLWVEHPETKERVRVVPGELRQRDVMVGRHVAISPGAIPRFLDRFAQVYGALGKMEATLAIAAAHHRLLWIHPFIDGNGRVARLMSHAMLLSALDTGALWSAARGLARNVQAYKTHLADCDLRRRNDLDGRGNLSEETLAAFTRFFLETCIDQVDFMSGLMRPDALRARILVWAEEQARLKILPSKSGQILEAVLFRGELRRADVAAIVGTDDRQARRIVAPLIAMGVLSAAHRLAPLRLSFPATIASRWLPNLFPDRT